MSKLTYAGFDLLRPVPDLMIRVQRWWDDHAPELWKHPGYHVRGTEHLPIPGPPPQRKLQINTLVWPQGASRWATMYALADAATVTKIRAAVDQTFVTDGCPNGAPLSWTLSPSGFLPTACAPLNLPMSLPFVGGSTWAAPYPPGISVVFTISGTTGTLTFYSTTIGSVTYTVTGISGCCAPLTLNKLTDGVCTSLPATIVLTPSTSCGQASTKSAELYLDGPDGVVRPQMILIDSRPVFVQGRNTDLRLLVLVDARYFWWGRTAFPQASTWTQLLRYLCLYAGGVTPTVPAIPAGYGTTPSLRWTPTGNVPLPLLIDAAAAQLGLRFLYQTNGSASYVTSGAAATADLSRYTANKKAIVQGGRLAVSDVIGNVPESVAVAFWGDVTTVETKILSDLALPAYAGKNGVSNAVGWAFADVNADAGVLTRSDWTTQAAKDYYGWALALSDYTLAAVRPLQLTGFEDRIEWEFSPGVPNSTHIESGRDASVIEEGVNPIVDVELTWKRTLTRVVPPDLHDRNVYGVRPPPGYSYVVKLVDQLADSAATCDLPWSAKIQTTDSSGCVVDGPWLGWAPVQSYVLLQVPGATPSPGDYVTATPDPLVAGRWIFTPGGGGDATRLVLLIAKAYTTGEFIAYSAVGVTASTGPPPITYTVNDLRYGPALSPPSPVYHLRNLDVPVCPPTVPGGWTPAFVDELSVVRIWPGPAGTWLFSTDAWQDLFRRTGEQDGDGDRAFLRYYDQNTGAWVDGREVRVIQVT